MWSMATAVLRSVIANRPHAGEASVSQRAQSESFDCHFKEHCGYTI